MMKLKMRAKAMAGADTTKTGEPDWAAMFARFMREHVVGAKPMMPDTLGGKTMAKGIMMGEDEKKRK